jgi:hypothetical protein
MSKKKRFSIIEWLTAISCGVISFSYFSGIDHNSKIVGPFLNSAFDYVSSFIGEIAAGIIAYLIFFGSGFFLCWICIWCLHLSKNKQNY